MARKPFEHPYIGLGLCSSPSLGWLLVADIANAHLCWPCKSNRRYELARALQLWIMQKDFFKKITANSFRIYQVNPLYHDEFEQQIIISGFLVPSRIYNPHLKMLRKGRALGCDCTLRRVVLRNSSKYSEHFESIGWKNSSESSTISKCLSF